MGIGFLWDVWARAKPILFVFMGCIYATVSISQDLKFDHISVEQGLSQGNVWNIYQDKLGFMWIGTEDGLNVFDGYTFTIYRNNPLDSTSISNNNIYAVIEDEHRNLWIGTQQGLNYYNRELNSFQRFFHTTSKGSLTSNNISSLFIDSHNTLWVGCGKGLNVYNPKSNTFKHFFKDPNNSKTLADDFITAILEDSQHRIWIGTDNGLSRLNNDGCTFTNFYNEPGNPSSLSSSMITSIFEDNAHTIWVGTTEGLNKMDLMRNTFVRYVNDKQHKNSIANNYIHHIAQDKQGVLWVATDGALEKMNIESGTFTHYTQQLGNENSLNSNVINRILFDVNNRMWLSTRSGGINIYDKGKTHFIHYKYNTCDATSLSSDAVTSFQEGKAGSFWIGTDGGGVNYFDQRTNRFTTYGNLFTSNKVLALKKDDTGGLWIGMWGGGLNYFNPDTKKIKRYKHDPENVRSLSDDNVFYILKDRKENIWVGTWGNGLNKYNAKTDDFTQFTHNDDDPNSISGSPIGFLLEDSNGKIWIATEQHGVDVLDPATNTFTHFKTGPAKGSLTSNSIFTLFEDIKKRIWIGTNGGGLNLYDPVTKTFKGIRQHDGLPNDGILGIQEDSQNNLWISTNKGLCCFNPDRMTFKNFIGDGLQGNQFNRWASARFSSGHLLFGGTNGFNIFHPDSIKVNTYKPPVYITSFKVFNKKVEVGNGSVLKKNITVTTEIELSYQQNVFSFEFSALNYRQPEKNQYRYKMDGFEDEWVEAGTEQKATYTNLSPGQYVFRVMASNNDGVWNGKERAVKITITPPFWNTWWFKILVFLIILYIIYSFIKIRDRTAERQKKELEDQVQSRTAEAYEQKEALEAQAEDMQTLYEQQQAQAEYLKTLNSALQMQKDEVMRKSEEAEKARLEAERATQAKSIFLATMSHEIRTPMNGVLGMAALMAETSLTREQQEYTDTIVNSGEALLTVINDILDFSKIESGNLELENHSYNLRKCIEDAMDLFAMKAAQKNLDLIYGIDPKIPLQIIGDSHRLRQILINLISNAMKFTHQGEILVRVDLVTDKNDELELAFHVRDTGIGIPADKISRLFKSFSQVDSSTTRKYGGTGLGLVISQRLVELMKGNIYVESQVGEGTTFIFTIKSLRGSDSVKESIVCGLTGDEGKEVLLVDDNKTTLTILKNQLEHWKLSVTAVLSGKEALSVMQHKSFDLVITDMQMPEMDGVELSRTIKEKYAKLPIILLSAVGDESKKKYPELFYATVNKPVKQQHLCKVLQEAIHPEVSKISLEEQSSKQVLSEEFAKKYPLRILLAEDNLVNQKLAIRVLNKLGYKNIDVALNGAIAIEKLNEQFYEVILMDMQMPEIDGLEATRIIRLRPDKQPIIIAMTANAMQEDREACMQAGMNDYISKPIKLELLIDALQKAYESYSV